jgi:hypothetical protein
MQQGNSFFADAAMRQVYLADDELHEGGLTRTVLAKQSAA